MLECSTLLAARLTLRLFLAVLLLVTAMPAHAIAFGLGWTLLPSEQPEMPFEDWTPKTGDTFVVDTENNIGYLVHANAGFTSFPVVTGQLRTVRYIGRTYFAATPSRTWTIYDNKEIKGDKTTFGPGGAFFRMFYDDERTSYGIHHHRSADIMLAEDDRYKSMGCVIVSTDVLDMIERTLQENDELTVITTKSIGEGSVNYATLMETVSAGKAL